jgi:hypothetical protein
MERFRRTNFPLKAFIVLQQNYGKMEVALVEKRDLPKSAIFQGE